LKQGKGIIHRFQNIYSVSPAKGALEWLEWLEPHAWKDAVQPALFRYLISNDMCLDLLNLVMQDLQRYERAERMAVLGLAAWKMEGHVPVANSRKGGLLFVARMTTIGLEILPGPAANSRAMTIIVESISPFLEAIES
jgi:hypothetical protein